MGGALGALCPTAPDHQPSSHGRATRGSGLTVEVFCPSENDPEGGALKELSQALLHSLELILPTDRAEYYIP